MRSLEKQLPLAAFALLTLVAAAITWAAYDHARSTTRALFGERLTRVSDQLVASMGPSITVLLEQLETAAQQPAVVRALATPGASDTTAARAVLMDAFGGLQPNMAVGAWDLSGDLVMAVRPDTAAWVVPPPLVEATSTTPLASTPDGVVHHGFVAPVRDGRRLVGFLQIRQRITSAGGPDNAALLEALLGESARVLLGSPGGAWTDMRTLVEAPPEAVAGAAEAVRYERDGVPLLGVGRALPGTSIIVVAEVGEAAALAAARSFLGRVGVIALLLVALATGAAWMLGRRITAPLAKLRAAAAGLGAGDYSRRAPEGGHPEIASVAAAFNTMASEMAGHVGALKASEERFRSLVTATAQIVWWTNAKGDVTEPLPSWQSFTGVTFEEMRGTGWTSSIHPDDAANALRVWKEAVEHQSLYEMEYRLRRHDGVYRWFLVRGVPILERNGTIREWVGTSTDITKRRETEESLRKKDLELQRSQRLDAIGRLAGGIAHDFNNLLTTIMGPAELAERQLPQDHPVREELQEIRDSARRAGELTKKLLAFGRQQVMAPVILDVNEAVDSAVSLLRRVIGESVVLDLALKASRPTVHVDRTQFEQIVINLAVNARDAMPDGGWLTLETADVAIDRSFAEEHHELKPGHYVLLAVTDTGSGMDPETQKQIFEPFFTTKEHEGGTGLGLSTVYGIVRQSGGHVWVYSEPGRGSSFKIYLPHADAETSAPHAQPPSSEPLPRGVETILFTEDDPGIRRLGLRILTELGYTVLPAGSGPEALELAARHGGDINLLVSDVVMAEMNGIELWELLRLDRAHLPALFISGWASEAAVKHGILDGQVPFLQKPFSPRELALKVHEVLATR
jgi:PAS domain S-box-containing protein